MAITYREWRDGDDLALLEIWGGPETEQARQFRGTLAPSGNAPWRRCIVAEDVVDGVAIPVAAGVVHEASLHPQRLWAYVEVDRQHRRAGVGSTLLTMLRHEAAQSPSGVTRLRTKVEPGTPGAAFVEAAGLVPVQRSRLVVVEPGALKLPVFGDGSEAAASEQVEDLATGSVELSDVVGRYYSSVHGWDSPGELSIATVQRLFLDELSGAHGAIVLRAPKASAFGQGVPVSRKGRLEAFAISYAELAAAGGNPGGADAPSGQPTDVFLGHEPKLSEDEARAAVRDLLALIAFQHPVLLELDDSMAALSAVVGPLLAGGQARLQGAETLVVSDPA
ncbi:MULTISPECIES: GNAT family N-acetyltransferase [unclassified Arthrobacter]|uniref:GNAT family N-acetyltransferase n=1 Tax=unclassified Arthrobacter TaxID=235627 RepID=UPI002E063763|nr:MULTISPECIES: GNAT family N-acetyltransferase [unclassified Arthrobacter]MEC5190472.1 GNAT superfamily N-acetyltransferase [Arthrobacter sp. MP_M4]MEC5201823.1 GNAT superfamily N-acetyltransferase [Arthrobacter sp. MP_M7]